MPYPTIRVKDLPTVVKVDIGDLGEEIENLAKFLNHQFKLNSSVIPGGLELKMDDVSTFALARMVTKFVYRKNLNGNHWVDVKNNVVKINRFNLDKKVKKNKHPTAPSTIKHGR